MKKIIGILGITFFAVTLFLGSSLNNSNSNLTLSDLMQVDQALAQTEAVALKKIYNVIEGDDCDVIVYLNGKLTKFVGIDISCPDGDAKCVAGCHITITT